jgi:hypothetical protein
MEFKRILQYLLMTLMPVYLVTGCGDLEPEMQDTMQDTRTVILKMDYHKKSSSRSSSSVFVSHLSQYNTHLILALPSGPSGDDLTIPEQFLSNNYKDFHTSFAKGLMNTDTRTVSLDIPQDKINKQMKIFAFLFQENYILPQLDDYSGTRTVGYYGKSQSFEIGTQTNLGLNICLIQVSTPTVSSVYPADNQNGVSITENISVTFSNAMNTTSVTTNTSDSTCSGSIQLSYNNFSNCVQMSSSPLSSNSYTTFTVDPSNNLSEGTDYKIRVTTGVKDTEGNSLSCQYETSNGFTTTEY